MNPSDVSELDLDAAKRALAQNWPDLETTSVKYTELLAGLATFHQHLGTERFELYYNLRVPRNRMEEWTQQHMRGVISDTELRELLEEDAKRPIDLEMLEAFYDAFQSNLAHYSEFLQMAIVRPRDTARRLRTKEKTIDKHAKALQGKLPLLREHLTTVFEFLDELRITSGAGLLKIGEYEATSAHWLAQILFDRLSKAWKSCRRTSARSKREPNYIYSAEAIDLFVEHWHSRFPEPQHLHERLREEFILARSAIKLSEGAKATIHTNETPVKGENCKFALPMRRPSVLPLVDPYSEPNFSDAAYDDILRTIESMVLVIERSPSAFKAMDEEGLRTHLLVGLNGLYEGGASGETFNGEGKTDILIRHGNRNVFIAECLMWKGQDYLLGKMNDQLFRYATWRDSKIAILVFNRNKDFGDVIRKMKATIRGHSQCLRELPSSHESGGRYTFVRADDCSREFTLTCLAFDIPM
jgi:hypothetical protein